MTSWHSEKQTKNTYTISMGLNSYHGVAGNSVDYVTPVTSHTLTPPPKTVLHKAQPHNRTGRCVDYV